ncbi:MAG TPA: glycosyltransferase 87 family protein, partial [Isosphaeraceae bacterium]|nr:glycosyltransferase 87 family protein [Isosphaeraceae bacterium]
MTSILWLGIGWYLLRWGRTWDVDLQVYRRAGHALLSGGGNPYLLSFTSHRLSFTYPPFALIVLSPLAWGPLGTAETIWWIVNAVCLTAVILVALRHTTTLRGGRAIAVAGVLSGVSTIVLEPVRSSMDYGQINSILMLMIVLDLTTLKGRWRGSLVGLAVAIKLTPLVFLGYFLVQRQWRPLVRAVTVFIGATVVGGLVLRADSFAFLQALIFKRGHAGTIAYVGNQSWLGLLFRAPLRGGGMALVLWIPLVLVTLAAGGLLAKRLVETGRLVEAVVSLALTEL